MQWWYSVAYHWSKENLGYLEDVWGQTSVKHIAAKVGHTEVAVILKAKRIGLEGCYRSTEYINANVVAKTMGVDSHCITDYWIKKCGLKAKKRALIELKMWFIKLEDLMKWLEDNKEKWDARKVEIYGLGSEPQWLKDKRDLDINIPKKQFKKWTAKEDARLIDYYKFGKKQSEIALILNRSESGIQRRLSRLKERGILVKQKIMCKWTTKEDKLFRELESKGLSDIKIAEELGRERIHVVDHRRNLRRNGLYERGKTNAC